jgi:polyhydroxyalkanoate synthesis regulator protein
METIKRFNNRKLYSKAQKKYVRLEYLVNKLRNKEPFQVIKHGTNEDITAKTLKQALSTVEVDEATLRKVLLGE